MIYNNETESSTILDESVQSIAIAQDIDRTMEDIKKEFSKETGKNLTEKEKSILIRKSKYILARLISLGGKGFQMAAISDTSLRLKNKIWPKKGLFLPAFHPNLDAKVGSSVTIKDKIIRNIIQFAIGVVLKLLSRKVDESASENIIKDSKSLVGDLKKIRDSESDENIQKFIDDKIEELETKIKNYEEAK